jgi:hypothetical protein
VAHVSGAPVIVPQTVVPVPQPAPRGSPPARVQRRSDALVPLRRLSARLTKQWLPGIVWSVSRTGRAGLVGLALVAASAVFFASTHLRIVDDVTALRSELAAARDRAAAGPSVAAADDLPGARNLPKRADMPALLGTLFEQADAAHLSIDTGKYDMTASKSGDFVRYKVSFPVVGPYPQVRQFVDATLKAMPAVAISGLSLERKSIGDGAVEAQIHLTFFTKGAP